eukprot:GEMP01060734.1.p1 GENE.GEMP01060734.1~~GEMP01060734.1.p1  ORF type:complete len:107 (-),score=2.52 GEMP01060734.1:575-895(-)
MYIKKAVFKQYFLILKKYWTRKKRNVHEEALSDRSPPPSANNIKNKRKTRVKNCFEFLTNTPYVHAIWEYIGNKNTKSIKVAILSKPPQERVERWEQKTGQAHTDA